MNQIDQLGMRISHIDSAFDQWIKQQNTNYNTFAVLYTLATEGRRILHGFGLCGLEYRYFAREHDGIGGRILFYPCVFRAGVFVCHQCAAVCTVLAGGRDGVRRFGCLLVGHAQKIDITKISFLTTKHSFPFSDGLFKVALSLRNHEK